MEEQVEFVGAEILRAMVAQYSSHWGEPSEETIHRLRRDAAEAAEEYMLFRSMDEGEVFAPHKQKEPPPTSWGAAARKGWLAWWEMLERDSA
jgi:hypothetical protein